MKQMIDCFFTTTKDNNIAFHVTSDYKSVEENRLNLSSKYNIDAKNLRYMNQVHGCEVQVVNKDSLSCIDNCDALISNEINLPLMVMVADCIPILLHDTKKNVIAVAHAGRNGTFLNIVEKTVLKMVEVFNCNTHDIQAILGPSIQKCCYEVSSEMVETVKNNFGETFVNGRLINLQGINKKQLLDLGLLNSNIKISEVCTKCSNADYYSYRLDNNCGRFAGIISLS